MAETGSLGAAVIAVGTVIPDMLFTEGKVIMF